MVRASPLSGRTPRALFIAGAALIALDQWTKWLARTVWTTHPVDLGFVSFVFTGNTGASFSLLPGTNTILVFISLIALGTLLYFHDSLIPEEGARARLRTWQQSFYVLLVAGIFGNLIDRVLLGYVTDFVDLGWWPVFNVADSCLSIGVTGFVVMEIISVIKTGMKKKA